MTKNTKNTDKKASTTSSASSAWAGCSTYPSEKLPGNKSSKDTEKTGEDYYKEVIEALKKLYQDFIEAILEEYWGGMDDDDDGDDESPVEEEDSDADEDDDEEEELLDLDSVSDGTTCEFTSSPADKCYNVLERQNEEITHKIEVLEDRVSKLEQNLSKLLKVSSEKATSSTTTTLILTDDDAGDTVEAIKAFFGLDD